MAKIKKKYNSDNKKLNIVICIAIIAAIGFGAAFAYNLYEYYIWRQDGQVAQENADIVREVFQDTMDDIVSIIAAMQLNPPSNTHQNNNEDQEQGHNNEILENYESESAATLIVLSAAPLQEIRELTNNPDIVAFIFIAGTNISNVVVQASDNEFYLNHDMFQRRNVNGAIFMDFRNTNDFSNPNTIIYGHNMRNGTMFHNLRYYLWDRNFFESHSQITIITDHQAFVYDIFSVFSTNVDFDYIQVDFGPSEFDSLIQEIVRRRNFNTGVGVTSNDRILILSTCTNVDDDTRIVVAARLSQIIEFDHNQNYNYDYESDNN